ncbi:HD domain-containing protein [Oryzicola mucosus]|uniref:Metal-dependent phosphohydrolase n=1 Tax=Oryzicola mucosus TaxID=2767425 RepID=A0A8J6PVV9_9HYPH|nr:hypothetical protein [Oryzicola mucosus]MBD0414983.1 hypothetical protein [Oryzicola mucosus]
MTELIDDKIRAELEVLYRAPDRHYHGTAHVEALLGLAKTHAGLLSDPEAVEAAIWFHDAIYDSTAKDNEASSAALAVERLTERTDPARLARIVAMIEATATHRLPALDTPEATSDAAYFLDMDLAVLGAEPDAFDAYEDGVRREYAWVDDASWRTGRAAVLKNFLDRPHLFHTPTFRENFEDAARANIHRSLEKLRQS